MSDKAIEQRFPDLGSQESFPGNTDMQQNLGNKAIEKLVGD